MQVESVLTPSSAPVVAGAMVAAYKAETGRDPPARSSWLIPVAQSAVETAHWKAMWNNNPGNYTHGARDSYDWFFIGHNALGEASKLQFRSYGSLGDGCRDLVRWLKSHGTLERADAGDVPGYVQSLQRGWYVGSDPAVYPKYEKAIASIVEQYKAIEPLPYVEPAARFSPAPFTGGPGAVASASSRRRGAGGAVAMLGLFGLGLAAVAGGRRRGGGALVRAAHVRAMRAELEPRFRQLFTLRSRGPALEHERAELLASWEHWRELEASGLHDGNADGYAAAGRMLHRRVTDLAGLWGPRGTRTGLTVPGEVTTYHRTWDPYVTGAEDACATCAARLAGEPGKAYARRREAIRIGWDAAGDLTAAEEMLSGGALLKLYRTTVDHAHEALHQVKVDCPDVPRPPVPTASVQAVVIGQLEGAGLIAKGSMEIIADTVEETASAIGRGLRSSGPWVALAVVGGAVLVLSRK